MTRCNLDTFFFLVKDLRTATGRLPVTQRTVTGWLPVTSKRTAQLPVDEWLVAGHLTANAHMYLTVA